VKRGVIVEMRLLPRKIFFTNGAGSHKEHLESFEMALRDAEIEKFNLVMVSSILPPNCQIIDKGEGLKELIPGEVVFCVMSRNSSNEPNRRVSASLGCAIPNGSEKFGYISEHHAFGETSDASGEYAEKLASSMYNTWTESEPKETFNISKSAVVTDDGLWTTVISVAVMLL
jgi:arginine decarboxylase